MWTRLRPRRADVAEQIDALAEQNQRSPDRDTERRLLALRHEAGARLLDSAPADPEFAQPDVGRLPAGAPLPEFEPRSLTAGLLRAAILRDGCALVRELFPRDTARKLADEIDRAYGERQRIEDGGTAAQGYYEEFQPRTRFGPVESRPWIKVGGGLLVADSPILSFAVAQAFSAAGLRALVSEYLGEPGLISVNKSTLRRAEPAVSGAWHQDGKFMGPVRSLNLWAALSRCGDEAPGLDLVPRRLEGYLDTGTEDAPLDWTVAERVVRRAAGEAGVIRPVFEPGDALFFDELFLHKTGSDPDMPSPRFAIENWFFGGSSFPPDYAPLAV